MVNKKFDRVVYCRRAVGNQHKLCFLRMESKFVKSEVSSYFEEFIINKFYKIRQVRTRSKKSSVIRKQ